MPATSKAQQQAAGIAHAVEKGKLPKSKLRGASKQMYKGMAGTGSLHKFAATKRKGLPKHVSEGVEAIKAFFGRSALYEGKHKAGCQCGFCKNKGNIASLRKGKGRPDDDEGVGEIDTEPEEPKGMDEGLLVELGGYYCFKCKAAKAPKWTDNKPTCPTCGHDMRKKADEGIEGEVKLSKGTHPGAANKAYSGMTSKQAMTPGWKPKAYIKAAAEVAGLPGKGQVKGFKNKSEGEMTGGQKVPKTRRGESVERVVAALLD